jgi:magnesium-transporting ATPase (P-type)
MCVKRVWPVGSKYIYHVTGGPMDATAGFALEHDPTNPDVHVEAELQQRLSRAKSRAMTRADRLTSMSNAEDINRKYRAPTFTHSVMRVVQGTDASEYTAVQEACADLALVAAMCNNTSLQIDSETDQLVGAGNPTELALQVFSYKAGLDPYHFEEEGWRKCGQWAFDSAIKCMSVGIVRDRPPQEDDETSDLPDGENAKDCLILTKGAPEAVLPKCLDVDMDVVMAKVTHLACQGYRVLACGVGKHLELDDVDGKRLHDYDRVKVEKDLK